ISVLAAVFLVASTLTVVFVTSEPAKADGCYTWDRTLKNGMSGDDVKQLQIRVAGWVTNGENLAIDGEYGPRTAAAVKKFKNAYNAGKDNGIAGSGTYKQLYKLQD